MNREYLLQLLSDGEFHTGSELGGRLGVTRSAIWKMLPSLEQLGVKIVSNRSKGYQIPGGLDLLNEKRIEGLLNDDVKKRLLIDLCLECTSTNDVLSKMINDGHKSEYLVSLTEYQSAGRGRRGRNWISPFCANLLCSVAFVLEGGAERLNGLSLVVGLAIADALDSMGVNGVGLKWPNDVYINNKKVAGVLLELSGEMTTAWKVVCGFGLNVHMKDNDAKEVDQPWTSLSEWVDCSRNKLAAKVLNSLVTYIDRFKEAGFSSFLNEWQRYDVLAGKEIKLMPAGVVGKACGVSYHGALLVETKEGLREVNAGEVSVRSI